MSCKPCSECGPETPHHWIPNDEATSVAEPDYVCKHCDAMAWMCIDCDVALDSPDTHCLECAGLDVDDEDDDPQRPRRPAMTTHTRQPPTPSLNPCQRPGCGDGAFLHNGPAGQCSVAFCGCQELVHERLFEHPTLMAYPDQSWVRYEKHAVLEDRVERLEALVTLLLRERELERIGAVYEPVPGWPHCDACKGKISSHGPESDCPGAIARRALGDQPSDPGVTP
jgi:hypothetical protein